MNRLPTPNRFTGVLASSALATSAILTFAGCGGPTQEQRVQANCITETAHELAQENHGLTLDPNMLAEMCADAVTASTVAVTQP